MKFNGDAIGEKPQLPTNSLTLHFLKSSSAPISYSTLLYIRISFLEKKVQTFIERPFPIDFQFIYT